MREGKGVKEIGRGFEGREELERKWSGKEGEGEGEVKEPQARDGGLVPSQLCSSSEAGL